MGSVICWKRTHILVFKFFFFCSTNWLSSRRHVLYFVFVYSFIHEVIQIDLDAEFGASVSPCVCAHPCASLHMCVRAVKPEEDQQSQKNCMSPGFTFYWCVSSSCPLHPIKASCVALLYVSKKPRDPYNLIGFCDSKKFSSGVSKRNPQKCSNKGIKKKTVLKTSMSTQSSITFL